MNTLFNDDRPCTIEELEKIITAPSGGLVMLPSRAYDEVIDGIFIGEGDSARSVNCMKRLGVTYVLNAALGKDLYHVNTNHVMYERANIHFLGIEATDFINCDLSKHFFSAADFIHAGVTSGGKVFVHCVQGVSRSATFVIAYLMIKNCMTVQDALRLVRDKREICPNPGFLQQLCNLDEKLRKSGHFSHGTNVDPVSCEDGSFGDKPEGKVEMSVQDCSLGDRQKCNQEDTFTQDCSVGDKQRSITEDISAEDVHAGNSDSDVNGCARPVMHEEQCELCTVKELENISTESSRGSLISDTECSKINDQIFLGEG